MNNTKLIKSKNIKQKSQTLKKTKNLQDGGGHKEDYVYLSSQITTQQNNDPNYKEVGVIHITESGAVNFITGFATGVANIFGSKGFDNSIYDRARNSAIRKIIAQIDSKQKICNLRMDVEKDNQTSLFFIHLYGTLLEKIKD